MKSEEALEKCFLTLRILPKHIINNVNILIDEIPSLFEDKREKFTEKKLQLVLLGDFEKKIISTGEIEQKLNEPFYSKNITILREDEVNEVIVMALEQIKNKIDSLNNNESYFQFVKVNNVDFKLREYKPLSGSSYIDLPQWIKSKKACINIKNEDDKCFKYCMLYHKYQNEIKDNPQELYQYHKYLSLKDYDFSNINSPVETDDIKKFCKQNNLSINLYIVKENSIYPYLTSSRDDKKENHINLLLIEKENVSHYVYIKNLSKLVRDQLTKFEHSHHICDRCFYYTSSIRLFNRHISFCENYYENEKAMPILPNDMEKILKFKMLIKQLKLH
jgi:hypothetical protein